MNTDSNNNEEKPPREPLSRPRRRGRKPGSSAHALTPQIEQMILAGIRAGAFPHIAAEAAGIPRKVFEGWLETGNPMERPNGWRPHKQYTPLWQGVMEAKAQARLAAELKAASEDPIAWLRSGPGKETINDPGWSMPIRPQLKQDNRSVNIFLSPQMQGIMASILQVLAPYPEARAAVAAALAEGAREPKMIEARPAPGSRDD
jgi:hypothetical protein